MARSGAAWSCKVLPSGRLTGAAKLTNGRKQFGMRKVYHSDVESGYSFYSTDSDDQVESLHTGLDRCAALLKKILQHEAPGRQTKQSGKRNTAKILSKPLLTKGNVPKKKGFKKPITPAHIKKEFVPTSKRKIALSTTPSKERELPSAAQSGMMEAIHMPCSQHSPVMLQKLCEHVQTQMSLLPDQTPHSSQEIPAGTPLPTSARGSQKVTAFHYQLPTSTSALSLQHTAHLLPAQSDLVDSGNECVPEMGRPVVCPAVCAAQMQSASAAPCAAPGSSPVPPLTPSSSGQEVTPNHRQQLKEADLIRCMQAHLSLLQSHEAVDGRSDQKCHHHCPARLSASGKQQEAVSEEHSEAISRGDELSVFDMAPVKDTSCKRSFGKTALKSRQENPEETAHEVKTVKYLLGELRALIADQDDSEMLRLLSEIEDCISLLPAPGGSCDTQAAIALAVQPLRSENAQLRRTLRILNQQLGEQERSKKPSGQSCTYESISLHSLNRMLQSQLQESLKGLESLQAKNEELLKILASQRDENKLLAKEIQGKEEELLESRQRFDIASTRLRMEVEEALANVKSLQMKLEASEKEKKILGITLRQRDAEVSRLRGLTRSLQGSMAKLLTDLTADNTRAKPEKGLSRALLEEHEKQMQPDPCPGSTAVMTYLRKLEMDQTLTDAELPLSKRGGELEMQTPACGKFAAEGSKLNNSLSGGGTSAPRMLLTSLEQDAETLSDSGTILEEQNKLDETVYIPLSCSASKSQQPVPGRAGVLPQARGAGTMLDWSCELPVHNGCERAQDLTILDKLSAGYSVKKPVENTLGEPGDKGKAERDKVHTRPEGVLWGAAQDLREKPIPPHPGTSFHTPVLFQQELPERKGPGVVDFSCSSLDELSGQSEWSVSSFSTFTSRDEEDFKNSLAALDANIAKLQRTLKSNMLTQ